MASSSFKRAKLPECDSTYFRAGKPLTGKFKPINVVLVYADWCGHCEQFAPEFIKFAKKVSGVKVFVMNEAKNGKVLEKLGIQGYPTLLKIKNGVMSTFQGERSVSSLIEWSKK